LLIRINSKHFQLQVFFPFSKERKKGRKERREGGREEGRKEGRKEERKEGRKEGRKEFLAASFLFFSKENLSTVEQPNPLILVLMRQKPKGYWTASST
jgi:flagellar biosynthesis/type III secretory pathway protein FliH